MFSPFQNVFRKRASPPSSYPLVLSGSTEAPEIILLIKSIRITRDIVPRIELFVATQRRKLLPLPT